MGKKEKAKAQDEKPLVKEKVAKKQESKGGKNKQKEATSSKKKEGKGCSNCCLFVTSLIVLSVAAVSYKVYEYVEFIPDMPELSMDDWWGPNNTRLAEDTSIRPFRIVFSDAMEADLRKRFESYRQLKKTKSFKDAAWTYGVNSENFAQFFAYWIFKYNFRERARFLNQYDHFKTSIQGLDIHYIHVKPKVEKNVKVLPLLLLHGWPGSFREFYEAIPLLTTPRPGYDLVFELIIPSLPGYGYSQAAVRPGLTTAKAAIIMRNLMKRLGFNQYYVQGGDMGHTIASSMATIFPMEVLGFHTNMAYVMNKVSGWIWILGGLWSALESLVEDKYKDRLYPLVDKVEFFVEESGYYHVHSTKPDTWGVALQESPAGLAAYILEKFVTATSRDGKFKEDGGLEGIFSKDALLDNIMIYWVTGTITSSMRLYKEKTRNAELEHALSLTPTSVPTWALRLKYEIFYMPEWLLKWKYTNLLGTTTLEEGGHFAALEKPAIFADDMFNAVKKFQEFHRKR